MGFDVDAFLRDLARGLRPRVGHMVHTLLQHLSGKLPPEVSKYEDIAALGSASVTEHVTSCLDALEHRLDPAAVTVSPAAVAYARGLARHGVAIDQLLRIYRLAHASLVSLLYEEAAHRTDDLELLHAAIKVLNTGGFEYVDRTSEQAVAAYQDERDRRLQSRLLLLNEASKRIGTALDADRTAQELADVSSGFADVVLVDLIDPTIAEGTPLAGGSSPALRRAAQQSVLESCLEAAVGSGSRLGYPAGSAPAHALESGQPQRCTVSSSAVPEWLVGSVGLGCLHVHGFHSVLLVPLWAHGQPLGLTQFFRHRAAEPFDDEDLLLAQEIVSRAAVALGNAGRYTRERSTALALQQSLLPQHTAQQFAVETASRYLPSGAGVGGDWYDVIPLSGARVALVMGDVVGRGLHAAATMGRLRMAVRTLADIDLPPDELLTHLDDVVIRLQQEDAQEAAEITATCLYMVYDPISRECSVASAGHLLPTMVTSPADGAGSTSSRVVDLPDVPVGPPLGLGGFPFETSRFEVPDGSLLALYTDGLVEDRHRDVDAGLMLLRDVLTQEPLPLETTCDRLLAALQPHQAEDDIALLVVSTRTLDPARVATWAIPSDPAAVAQARRHASAQLTTWGLDEMAFTTALVISELVTNAIRYGKAPIQLRMVLESTLTCEVSDAGSSAPHLRRARRFDEGGRGLLLVAQLADRWGTRRNREGKTIWAEQSLPQEMPPT